MRRLKKKRGRKSNYLKSLNDPYYKEARRKCMIRDRFKCKRCGSKILLEFHHISYHVLRKELEGTNLKWTVILCENCHELVHNDINHQWNPKNKNKTPILE